MAKTGIYQKYVFDVPRRRFIGKFEKMYAREHRDGFDSWQQDTLTTLQKQISLTLLQRRNFHRVLDFGCGKGAFTHLLKKENNEVTGADLSPTAIRRARARFPELRFAILPSGRLSIFKRSFDLIVFMEVLSYLRDWESLLREASRKTSFIYITLHVPPGPIGFVPSFDALRSAVSRDFSIATEVLIDHRVICLLARSKRRG